MTDVKLFTDLLSLQEARDEKSLHYFTGKPCSKNHISKRLVSTRQCMACSQTHSKNFREFSKKSYGNALTYFDSTPCSKGHVGNRYTAGKSCITCHKISSKEYRKINGEVIKERIRIFKKNNPHKVNADTAKRRAAKQQATPLWVTKEMFLEIRDLYKVAKLLEKKTGIVHHVDHIVPLNGKDVSGLHVPWNLRVITATENLSKSNKLLENIA